VPDLWPVDFREAGAEAAGDSCGVLCFLWPWPSLKNRFNSDIEPCFLTIES